MAQSRGFSYLLKMVSFHTCGNVYQRGLFVSLPLQRVMIGADRWYAKVSPLPKGYKWLKVSITFRYRVSHAVEMFTRCIPADASAWSIKLMFPTRHGTAIKVRKKSTFSGPHIHVSVCYCPSAINLARFPRWYQDGPDVKDLKHQADEMYHLDWNRYKNNLHVPIKIGILPHNLLLHWPRFHINIYLFF